jgi:hypothetical protein
VWGKLFRVNTKLLPYDHYQRIAGCGFVHSLVTVDRNMTANAEGFSRSVVTLSVVLTGRQRLSRSGQQGKKVSANHRRPAGAHNAQDALCGALGPLLARPKLNLRGQPDRPTTLGLSQRKAAAVP